MRFNTKLGMRALLTSFLIVIAILAFGQTADELNKKSVEFLGNRDTKSAFPLVKRAAELGHREAQYNYGYFYQQGIEVEKNDSIANIWLLKSAEQEFVNAQFKIAYSYAVGRGTVKSPEKAFYWTRKCAMQGDPECISNLIGCYSDGFGTEKNLDSAFVWTVRVASLPDVENLQMSGIITNARKALALKYLNGDFVKKDELKAYMWFLIYNESKRDFSILEQGSNIEQIKELEKQLSEEDIKTAKDEAEKQIQRKLKNLANLHKKEF